MIDPANGSQRWVGEVNTKLDHISQQLTRLASWQDAHGREDAMLFGKLEAHSAWAEEFRDTTMRRLGDHDDAILELRRLVYKGVAVGVMLGTVAGSLAAVLMRHLIGG